MQQQVGEGFVVWKSLVDFNFTKNLTLKPISYAYPAWKTPDRLRTGSGTETFQNNSVPLLSPTPFTRERAMSMQNCFTGPEPVRSSSARITRSVKPA
ncbi:hypothetical protein ElyMa_000724500 [Elysia marginata]|uniref:Uncharacterized protein n=1 Tax=Elysia marginata TaxID=1093978 RepID=A0AAV4GLL3_9GAST|nr:hypothetical protein ElyMa_000724500 [Elysia marginata]